MHSWLALLLLLASGCSRPVGAATWYMDAEAAGAGNGASWQDAWRSPADVRWGAGGVSAGDTLFLSGGRESATYREVLRPGASGEPGAPITIRPGTNEGHRGTVILTAGADGTGGGIALKSVAHIRIDGEVGGECRLAVRRCGGVGISLAGATHNILLKHIEVDGNGDTRDEHGIQINVSAYESPIVEISHCRIHDNFQDQINATRPSGRAPDFGMIRVHDCEIYNLADDGFQSGIGGVDFYNNRLHGRRQGGGPGHPDGLQFMNDRVRIWNNTFSNLDAPGLIANSFVFLDLYTGKEVGVRPMSDFLVYNNVLYEEGLNERDYLRGIAVKVERDSASAVTNLLIANNTIVGMPAWGLSLGFNGLPPSALERIVIENNVFQQCARNPECRSALLLGIDTDLFTTGSHGDAADLIFDYNCLSPGRDGAMVVAMKGVSALYKDWAFRSGCQANGFMAEPVLDAVFRPMSRHSPLIDAGAALDALFSTDRLGTGRPVGPRWDIGAFEYTGDGESGEKR